MKCLVSRHDVISHEISPHSHYKVMSHDAAQISHISRQTKMLQIIFSNPDLIEAICSNLFKNFKHG